MPRQERSRERVERILEAAATLVMTVGVDKLGTRSIAEEAGLPVASLYQYFSDKEAVLVALCERDMEEMDRQVVEDLGALAIITVPALVEASMRAFVKVYHRRPAFMQIWMRGRTNPTIYERGRHHNRRVARDLLSFARDAGLVDPGTYSPDELPMIAELAVELADHAFMVAFERDPLGDSFIIDQAIDAITSYVQRIAVRQT